MSVRSPREAYIKKRVASQLNQKRASLFSTPRNLGPNKRGNSKLSSARDEPDYVELNKRMSSFSRNAGMDVGGTSFHMQQQAMLNQLQSFPLTSLKEETQN